MRFLVVISALAFSVSAVSVAQACTAMKTAKSDEHQIVATDKAPQAPNTPIVIPKKSDKSEG